MEQIRSADVLASFPQVDEEKLNAALAAEAAASNRKIIVLDDDPTGVQTVKRLIRQIGRQKACARALLRRKSSSLF